MSDTQIGSQSTWTLGTLFSEGWEFFTKHFVVIITIVLVISVPIQVFSAFFDVNTETISTEAGLWDSVTTNIFEAQSALIIAIFSLVGILIPVALAIFVKETKNGAKLDMKATIQKAFTRWPSAMVTTLIGGILLVGLFFLLVIPGILFSVWWFFAIYAVALSNKSGMNALRYSKELVSGRWWTIFGYLFLFALLSGVVTSMLTWPVASAGGSYLGLVIAGVLADVVTSFFIVVTVILFLRLEKTLSVSTAASPE